MPCQTLIQFKLAKEKEHFSSYFRKQKKKLQHRQLYSIELGKQIKEGGEVNVELIKAVIKG